MCPFYQISRVLVGFTGEKFQVEFQRMYIVILLKYYRLIGGFLVPGRGMK